jgi:hypothetical protein
MLAFATTQMSLEDIVLCETIHIQKTILYNHAYMWNLKESQIHRWSVEQVVMRGKEGEDMRRKESKDRISLCQMNKSTDLICNLTTIVKNTVMY